MKTTKLRYYSKHIFKHCLPDALYRHKLENALAGYDLFDKEYIESRVNYYLKQTQQFSLNHQATSSNLFHLKGKKSAYYFDLIEHLRYFPDHLKFSYLFGDITYIPEQPSFVKSRPINEHNQNSVILKLDSVRHFQFPQDPIPFENKRNKAIFRGDCHQSHRHEFLKKCFGLPKTNIGDTRKKAKGDIYYKEPMPIRDHFQYKFILSVEGNDVATNLKWILNSNSLCFMRRPKYETWFMEGRLIPNHHYVLLKDDYSDLTEKMAYYQDHIDEAKHIIRNANLFAKQFQDKKREKLISLLVIKRYLERANPGKMPIGIQTRARPNHYLLKQPKATT